MKNLPPRAYWILFIKYCQNGFLILLLFFNIFISYKIIINSPMERDLISELTTQIELFISTHFGFILFSAFVTIILSFAWTKLAFNSYKYKLTEDGFYSESGLLFKNFVTIPYNRIQNVNINRSILLQILRLSEINIQTAGSFSPKKPEGLLLGVSIDEATNLYNEIMLNLKKIN